MIYNKSFNGKSSPFIHHEINDELSGVSISNFEDIKKVFNVFNSEDEIINGKGTIEGCKFGKILVYGTRGEISNDKMKSFEDIFGVNE